MGVVNGQKGLVLKDVSKLLIIYMSLSIPCVNRCMRKVIKMKMTFSHNNLLNNDNIVDMMFSLIYLTQK